MSFPRKMATIINAIRFSMSAGSLRPVAPDARRSWLSRLVSSTYAFIASAAASGAISLSFRPARTRSSMTGRRMLLPLAHAPVTP